MDNTPFVEVRFSPEENQLYKMLLQRCEMKKTTPSDYIKNLIKTDLAWGHFARRDKKDRNNP